MRARSDPGRRRRSIGDPRSRLLRGVELEDQTIDVAGIRTAVLTGGSGPPMVLLHGGIECGGVSWTPVLGRLVGAHRLIVPDVPGLGASEPAARLDRATSEAWLTDLLDRTCAERPVLVGHSLGGSLAARFATRFSQLLRRLVIYGAPGIGPYRMPVGLRIVAVRCSVRPTERNLARFERWAFRDREQTWRRDPAWHDAFIAETRSRATTPHVKRTMRLMIQEGAKQISDADLRRIGVPTALLWGREDRMVPLALAESARARLGLPLHIVDGAGHAAHIEAPDAFADALERALEHRLPTATEWRLR